MKLKKLLSQVTVVNNDVEIRGMTLDSRKVQAGDVFFALQGAEQHGLEYARQAIADGAVAVIYQPSDQGDDLVSQLTEAIIVPVDNLAEKLGGIAARFYAYPSRKLDVLGITGTNGKTSCSQFMAQMLPECGIIGTLGWGEWGNLTTLVNTTPDAVTIQSIIAAFVQQQKTAVAMEVSSHGLQQGRVNGVVFKGAVLTNISRDHLDYHGSMAAYIQAKLGLLAMPDLQFAVVNLDDSYCDQIIAAVSEGVVLWGYSAQGNSQSSGNNIIASNVKFDMTGIACDITWGNVQARLNVPVYGDFNLENVLAVLTTLLALDITLPDAVAKLKTLQPVTGRMECFSKDENMPMVFVDYAHTPDALEKVLTGLRKYGRNKIWVVFGCGGDRDQGKRPQMGSVAEKLADCVVVTDDNPRKENAEKIIEDILSGCQAAKVQVIQDRKQAIEQVIEKASVNDLVLVAGKGHEQYQERDGVKKPFSDRLVVQQSLLKRCA